MCDCRRDKPLRAGSAAGAQEAQKPVQQSQYHDDVICYPNQQRKHLGYPLLCDITVQGRRD